MSYDPVSKVVQQADGRIIYSNGFGGISTIEPNNHRVADLEDARKAISTMDKKAHNWR